MYFNVTAAGIHVAEADVFTEFEVRSALDETGLVVELGSDDELGWGYFADGHVWVSRERIIAEVEPFHEHAAKWRERFDGMLSYAATQGWVDDSGDFVRAHVVYV